MMDMAGERLVGELSRARCLDLLRTATIGRVVLTNSAMPTAMPVSFALADGDIVFRAGPGTRLEPSAAGTVVAFEADVFDPEWEQGWSVVATGVARPVDSAREIRALDAMAIPSWVTDEPGYVRMTVGLLTGWHVRSARQQAADQDRADWVRADQDGSD